MDIKIKLSTKKAVRLMNEFSDARMTNMSSIDEDLSTEFSYILIEEFISNIKEQLELRTIKCMYCGKNMVIERSGKKFCSDRCRIYHWRDKISKD